MICIVIGIIPPVLAEPSGWTASRSVSGWTASRAGGMTTRKNGLRRTRKTSHFRYSILYNNWSFSVQSGEGPQRNLRSLRVVCYNWCLLKGFLQKLVLRIMWVNKYDDDWLTEWWWWRWWRTIRQNDKTAPGGGRPGKPDDQATWPRPGSEPDALTCSLTSSSKTCDDAETHNTLFWPYGTYHLI